MISRKTTENLNNRLGKRSGRIIHVLLLEKLANQGNCCAYCGKSFKETGITIDHVIPTNRGGRNTIHNVVLSCRPCNTVKGGLTLEEWQEKQAELADLESLIAEVGEEFLEEGKYLIDYEEEELMLHGELDFIC